MRTRPALTTNQTHRLGLVAFARAASMGGCLIANLPSPKTSVQPWTNAYEDGAHPGMEDDV